MTNIDINTAVTYTAEKTTEKNRNATYRVVSSAKGWLTIECTSSPDRSEIGTTRSARRGWLVPVLVEAQDEAPEAPVDEAEDETTPVLVEAQDEAPVDQDQDQDEDEADDEDETETRNGMARHIKAYASNYKIAKNASGSVTKICGDSISQWLLELEPLDVVELVSGLLGLDLATRYGHLNPGQKRMNSGNLLRSAISKGRFTEEQLSEMQRRGAGGTLDDVTDGKVLAMPEPPKVRKSRAKKAAVAAAS